MVRMAGTTVKITVFSIAVRKTASLTMKMKLFNPTKRTGRAG